ncbi:MULTISPECIES: Arc family DNA-binding protein [Streptomyces]
MNDRHQTKPYPLRVDGELRQRLEDAAKSAGRSLNSEISDRLERSFFDNSFSYLMDNRISEYERLREKSQSILKLMNELQSEAHEMRDTTSPAELKQIELIQQELSFLHQERSLIYKLLETISDGFNTVLNLGYSENVIVPLPGHDETPTPHSGGSSKNRKVK